MGSGVINIPLSFFEESFKFKTAQTDISINNIDINTQYAFDASKWNDGADISFSKIIVTDGKISVQNTPTILRDLLSSFANDLWSVPKMSGVLGNRTNINNHFNNLDISLNYIIRNNIINNCGTIGSPVTGTSNIIYDCLVNILNSSASSRITSLFTASRNTDEWIAIPFIVGDVLKLNIEYDNVFVNNINENPVSNRTYSIYINLS
tara:strand:+ start:241 stop:861 length:621 start_codon:yes stop_codon:yes gene_type:complete